MEISFIGLGVGAAVWLLGTCLGSPLIVGLIVSVAFGSTSAVTLSALGGSSPLLYLVFEAMLVGWVVFDKRQLVGIKESLGQDGVSQTVAALIVYSAAGAFIMPRLFAGATNAFVAGRATGVVEVALAPNSGNLTQTGYFLLGALAFLVLSSRFTRGEPLSALRNGFLALATINAFTGALDLGAKMAGAGDVFKPIRTATFAFLTEVEQAGFWRINGLYSEASGFGGAALASLAFTFTYWAYSGSRRALLLAGLLLVLLVLSTSSTAYAGLAILTIPVAASLIISVMRGQLRPTGMAVLACIIVGLTAIILVSLYDAKILDPFQHLFQTTVLDKSESESGRERAYWNQRSLLSFYETFGLGIGFGSSRASNWLIAVISQLGLVGALLQLSLVIPFLRRPQRPERSSPAYEAFVLHRSLCACVFSMLMTAIVAGGGADPGLLFFVALAGVVGCQASLTRSAMPADIALPASLAPMPALSTVRPLARAAQAVRPELAVADIFRRYGPTWRAARADLVTPAERKVMSAIETCRTAALGGHVEACVECEHRRIIHNSCRNRHCPTCQGDDAPVWLAAREADLLPVAYYNIVFTVPTEVAEVALHHKAVVYDLLFKAASETMMNVAADPQYVGARIGMTAVLHTWSPTMTHHPHIHMIGPCGGLSRDGGRWIAAPGPVPMPVDVLSGVFRRLVQARLRELQTAGRLPVGNPDGLSDRYDFTCPLAPSSDKAWVVYAKPLLENPEAVLACLSRYSRLAILNDRVISIDGPSVTIRDEDRLRAGTDRRRVVTLEAEEFIRRFLLHVLPKGFHRIRHYGLLANSGRKANVARARALLAAPSPRVALDAPVAAEPTCPSCGGRMMVMDPNDPAQDAARTAKGDRSERSEHEAEGRGRRSAVPATR